MTLVLTDFRGHPVLEDRWNLLHRHALGTAGGAFAAGLDEGRLVASRCPSCARTLLPPRAFCERCFVATELADFPGRTGELLSFTIVRREFTDSPPAPFAIGYARLEGADTALGALIAGVDLGPEVGDPALRVGMAVEVDIAGVGLGMARLRMRPAGGR